MASRPVCVAVCLLCLAGCGRFLHRPAPDASTVGVDAAAPSSSASSADGSPSATPDDEEEAITPDGGACPMAIHPGYCRHGCKPFSSRALTRHARRVGHAARAGLGKCGDLDVFAEDEAAGDAGVKSGIVEFFDHRQGVLVGAIDTRLAPCGEFGTVPKCTPVIAWEKSHSASVRMGVVTTSGNRLPVEVIQRIVRQNFARFRLCYLESTQPAQEGRVVTKFVIAKDGSVSSAEDAGSDLTDKELGSCVVRAFSALSFPEPEGGPMTVTFPLLFSR